MTDPTALRQEALRNIRRLLKENHPDINKSPKAQAVTRFLITAEKLVRRGGDVKREEARQWLKELDE